MRAPALAPVGRVTTIGAAPAMTGLCWALCALQARRARRAGRPYVDALPASGLVGAGLGHVPVRITWLGDSLAAGLGCDDVTETPAHLSARLLERAVDISMLAVPGARVAHVVEEQLPLLDRTTDIVVLCVGANDVAGGTSRRRYAALLDELLTRLTPIPTVVLTLPDITMADRIGQPLRALAGARARLFEWTRAEVAAAHAHVTSVDIASRPAGLSRREGRTMLCSDRFHPGALGYRVWAERIATACRALLEPPAIPTMAD